MWVRLTIVKIQPDKLDEMRKVYYEEIVPTVKSQTGNMDIFLLEPVKEGVVTNFDISVREQDDGFAFRFTGYIRVLTAGDYIFYTASDDGSKLYIGDTVVVNNDGPHGVEEKSGIIGFRAGYHPITVTMFHGGGNEVLEVRYEGPGIIKTLIPDNVLSRLPPLPDLNDDGIANFKDLAILVDEWLEEELWPQW